MRAMRWLTTVLVLGLVTAAAAAERPLAPKRKGKGAVIQFFGGTKSELAALMKSVPGVIRAEPTHRDPLAEDLLFVEYNPNRVSLHQLTTIAGGRGVFLTRFAFG